MQVLADLLGLSPTMELRWFIFMTFAILGGWAVTLLVFYANLVTSNTPVFKSDIAVGIIGSLLLGGLLAFFYVYGVNKNLHTSIPSNVYEILQESTLTRTPLVNDYFELQTQGTLQ